MGRGGDALSLHERRPLQDAHRSWVRAHADFRPFSIDAREAARFHMRLGSPSPIAIGQECPESPARIGANLASTADCPRSPTTLKQFDGAFRQACRFLDTRRVNVRVPSL
jgi:hypothetical protein